MKDIVLKKCQSQMLMLLKYVDSLCEKHDIKYSLSCGTMIGAVREKGFIPWDDDSDIIFTRKEYNKFLDILKKETLPKYVGIYDPKEKSKFIDFNFRIYYKTDIVRDSKECIEHYDGIFSYSTLDLYVLDEIPNNKIANRLFVLKHQIIFGLGMSKREHLIYSKYSFIEKIAVFILSSIGKLFSTRAICELHDKTCSKYMGRGFDKYYATSWVPTYPEYQYDISDFSSYIKVPFEDTKLMIIEKYDKVLRYDYGNNYMTPIKTHQHDENFVSEI